jgi:hypothetical protein
MTDESNAQTQTAADAAAQPQEPATPDVAALEAELTKARDEMLRALAEVENTAAAPSARRRKRVRMPSTASPPICFPWPIRSTAHWRQRRAMISTKASAIC